MEAMGFAERAAARRRSRDLKNGLKELQKQILASGGVDKATLAAAMKELGEAIELGAQLAQTYAEAYAHLKESQASIVRLLDCMAETPAAEVRLSLDALMKELGQVCHDCAIRKDDLDFCSTVESLGRLSADYSEEMSAIDKVMLRSELENVKAVLDDAAGWRAPDFLAVGYCFIKQDKDTLRDMENEQRNQYVVKYWNEHFMDWLLEQCRLAGVEKRMEELIQTYVK